MASPLVQTASAGGEAIAVERSDTEPPTILKLPVQQKCAFIVTCHEIFPP
ncbi:hypothetical protein [Thioclava sp. GXIMD2076]